MPRIFFASIVLVVLLFCGTVEAAYIDAARAAFPGHACIGQEQLVLADDLPVRRIAETYQVKDEAGNWIGPANCLIRLNRSLWRAASRYRRCLVIVHEAAHWSGFGHNVPGLPVTNDPGQGHHPACGLRPTPRRNAERLLRALRVGAVRCWPLSCHAGPRRYRLTQDAVAGTFKLTRIP